MDKIVDLMGNEIKRGDLIGVVANGIINKGVFDKEAKSGTVHWHSLRPTYRSTDNLSYAAMAIQNKERPRVEFSVNTDSKRFIKLDPTGLIDNEKESYRVIKDYLDPQI